VVSALASINVVNRHWARLVLGWVTAYGLKRGVLTCVGWQVTLCDPIWQVTLRRCDMEFH